MGHLIIDPRRFPKYPNLYTQVSDLTRRVNGTLDRILGPDAAGEFYCIWRVNAEDTEDQELARLWEQVQAEYRSSPRWGAGERKKRRPKTKE
jgi:glycine/D-amino acid oxidase-like deaminating enzyme